MKRIFIYGVLTLILAATVTGCSKEAKIIEEAKEYTKTELSFDTDFSVFSNISVFDNTLSLYGIIREAEPNGAIIKIDLTDFSLSYDFADISGRPSLIEATDDGYVLVTSDPANFADDTHTLCILDSEFNIISEKPLYNIIESIKYSHETVCLKTSADRIYLASEKTCAVLDLFGNTVDNFGLSGNVKTMQISDGKIYFVGNSTKGVTLDIFDIVSGKTENADRHQENLREISVASNYSGTDDILLIRTETEIISYNFKTAKTAKEINFVNTGIAAGGVGDVIKLGDGFLIYGYDIISKKSAFWLLSEADNENIDERTTITVSYMEDGTNKIPLAAIKFNESQSKYRIECIEYRSVYDSDSGKDFFSAYDGDILTGKIGDVLVMSNDTDYAKYAEKGALADLYELMENDGFSAGDLYECVKKPFEMDGKLFVMIPEFEINTIFAKSANLPDGIWNIENMLGLAKNLTDGELFMNLTRSEAFRIFLSAGADEFINFEEKSCEFENDRFKDLLGYIASLPEKSSGTSDSSDARPYINDEVYFYEENYFGSIGEYMLLKARFGFDSEIKMVGFPSKNGGASAVIPTRYYAVSSSSSNREGAWEFIKFMLSGQNIVDEVRGMRSIPASRFAFREWLESEQKLIYYFKNNTANYRAYLDPAEIPGTDGYSVSLTDEYIKDFEQFINSIEIKSKITPELWNIISEETDIYFSGAKNIDETVKIIQNRVGIYLGEK